MGFFFLPPKPQRSRRRVSKKKGSSSHSLTVVAPNKVTKKRALQAYQDELVARSDLPVSNSFTPLRIVKKNSINRNPSPSLLNQEGHYLTLNGSTTQLWPYMRPTRRYAIEDSAKTDTVPSLFQLIRDRLISPGNREHLLEPSRSRSNRDLHMLLRTRAHLT